MTGGDLACSDTQWHHSSWSGFATFSHPSACNFAQLCRGRAWLRNDPPTPALFRQQNLLTYRTSDAAAAGDHIAGGFVENTG